MGNPRGSIAELARACVLFTAVSNAACMTAEPAEDAPKAAAETAACGAPSSGGTLDYGEIRDVGFAGIPIADVIAGPNGYHIGLDILFWGYNPGHHSDDPFYGACAMAQVGPLS